MSIDPTHVNHTHPPSTMDDTQTAQPPIGDYAAIGNGHTMALVSRSGSIDWWCPMRFDRPSVFARILDLDRGGSLHVRPVAEASVQRRYIGETNVLETTFETDTGRLRISDVMPLQEHPDGNVPMYHGLLRLVECLEGEVEVELLFAPRPDYGRVVPDLDGGPSLVRCTFGGEALGLRSDFPLEVSGEGTARAREKLQAGDRRTVSLTYADGEPLVLGALGEPARRMMEETLGWWRSWSARCGYDGPYREAVVRSALVLKMMQYAPSGAVVAAPTTSLPEEIGGVRNWDYRYCWLRDASLTIRALLELGFMREAGAFVGWLLHATHLTWPELEVFYDVFGNTHNTEEELDHLSGYRGSRPVRVGNGAASQRQLDLYGEVIASAHEYVMRGGHLARNQLKSLGRLGEHVMGHWEEPDDGIWEMRGEPRHHVHSKLMCWRALDALIGMHENGDLHGSISELEASRQRIQEAIEDEGYDEEVQSYTMAYDLQQPDAALLLMVIQGFAEADSERMQSTYRYLERHLRVDGLWYRYPPDMDDGLPGGEGAFGICSFWGAEYLARRGDVEEARGVFEHLLTYASDVGLYAEEVDPSSGEALGNYPQAFTHTGLINAAVAIERAEEDRALPASEVAA